MAQAKTPAEIFNKNASAYQERFMNFDLYNDTYEKLCELITKPNAKVLEIGCGPANISRYLLSKKPGLKITGIDLAKNMIALAKKNCPTGEFKVMDCRDVSKLKEKFDVIICGFCMPYLSKVESIKLIGDSSVLLESEGLVYLSVIEDLYSKSGYETGGNGEDKCFIYYHEGIYLDQALERNCLEIIFTERKHFVKNDGSSSTHLVLIAGKK